MAPKKKGEKMSLNAFLGDSSLGSWADEMDALPSAPAQRTDEERARANDRGYGRRDDFLSTRPDRGPLPPREDVPLPTQPPYTAFVGNLPFDLTEADLEEHFGGHKTKSVKIIRDRDDKPKGFGYVEFEELDGLKDALSKSGTTFASRTIRVSVAEPPKERGGFGSGGGFDDDKFEGNWRREGPLPTLSDPRDSSRRRFDGPPGGERPGPTVSETASDWRSNRPSPRLPDPEVPQQLKRRGSGFSQQDNQTHPADTEERWSVGSKFKPSAPAADGPLAGRFGSLRGREDGGPPKEASPADEGDWRSSARPRPTPRNSTSPSSSTPPTPQLSRRKLELLPRSTSGSVNPSPISSPASATNPNWAPPSRSNPFGAAKPVDVTARESVVAERIEKEREERHLMSRTSSRTASDRNTIARTKTPPPAPTVTATPPTPGSPRSSVAAANSTVRPAFSFANAAGGKKEPTATSEAGQRDSPRDGDIEQVMEKVSEVTV